MTKKEALLQAAKELFGEYGYAETTFAMISQRAQVAMGLLAHHYGNKEKLFLAAGMDVLENLLTALRASVAGAPTGLEAVLRFCRCYLEFSREPGANFLVLIRCSPYSDMKTREDREIMITKFTEVHILLRECTGRGLEDGTIAANDPHLAAQFLSCVLVGAVRTKCLTPYATPGLYDEVMKRIEASLKGC
ncbi:transcriptional regulator, TetR family [Desulfovibrio sp. X2]|uniref:TetR/AcrR family transcriptional regulator n=1 Tax=Desulfovibrio sp. X2 TaxID=941449 RepID=UPI000358C83D|nr:TetR/AcrR family transcriptional regulator [Desulfovibrio sp. X2]EPR44483.1 transcriptional regulator, TetR family [Desulfovibrio sp. X2]